MNQTKFESILQVGENIAVEFKRCGNGIEHDVYESVCSFLNRFGGDIFMGVLDDGTVDDRVDDADVKVTSTSQIAVMYIRKQNIFTEKYYTTYPTRNPLNLKTEFYMLRVHLFCLTFHLSQSIIYLSHTE